MAVGHEKRSEWSSVLGNWSQLVLGRGEDRKTAEEKDGKKADSLDGEGRDLNVANVLCVFTSLTCFLLNN